MKCTTCTACLLAALSAGPRLHAVAYPPRAGDQVNDFAEVIDAGDEAEITKRIMESFVSNGVPIVVVTIRSLAEQVGKEAWTIERYAAGLYNEWGIGDARLNKGLLLLVAVADRKIRITSGAGYGNAWDALARRIIDEEIVPRFRRGDISGGISDGVKAMIEEVKKGASEVMVEDTRGGGTMPGGTAVRPPATGEGGTWQPPGTGVGLPGKRGWGIGTIVFLGFVVMGIFALISFFRGKLRRAPGGFPVGQSGSYVPGSSSPGGLGGWGGLLTGGLLGYFGSRMLDGFNRRRASGGSTWGGGSGGGFTPSGGSSAGGGSAFGGGYSSGGGATGSW